ncbi:MAG: D-glycero-beta-D-manno-heptose 1-phosphate adenylyltransferase [Marinoscillum sp.]|uniref:D-glycero-beta-D-manno-heptose 1-phosphate adenylyltransferase n=1 Tax=Marinoscillum sp. TaxID=2024838 RepID=UPI0032FD790F
MNPTAQKIVRRSELPVMVAQWRRDGQQIVFTNGCFDLLHLGHIDGLEKARRLGDRLIVGLNSDASVQRLKGEDRPLNNENIRSRMLAALEFVDVVVIFDEDTPASLIAEVLPDVLVKGSDYQTGNIAGSDIVLRTGGRVELIELTKGFSTTSIIEQIKRLNE